MSRSIQTARSWWVVCVAATLSLGATHSAAAQYMLDDFSTGAFQETLQTGEYTNTQAGKTIVGGSRTTIYGSCPTAHCSGGGVGDNPFNQPNSFEIRPGSATVPSALIFNSGYKTYPYLMLQYGYGTPMKVALAPTYDRIRVTFDGANQAINFNILLFSNSGSLNSALGCNLLSPNGFMTPFSAEFPFKNFTPGTGTPGADFGGVTNIIFELGESEGTNMEATYAVTSIQAVAGHGNGAIVCGRKGR